MNYKELCEAFDKNRIDWNDYRQQVFAVFSTIFDYFEKQLGLPEGENEAVWSPIPPDKEKREEGKQYTPYGGISFNDDGWARMGVSLTLRKGYKIYPQRNFILTFWLRKRKTAWIFKGFSNGQEFQLDAPPKEESLQKIYLDVFQYLHNSLSEGFDRFVNETDEQPKKPIGFQVTDFEKDPNYKQ